MLSFALQIKVINAAQAVTIGQNELKSGQSKAQVLQALQLAVKQGAISQNDMLVAAQQLGLIAPKAQARPNPLQTLTPFLPH